MLSAALELERGDRTLTSLIYAISHLRDQRILSKLLTHVSHPNPEVRLAVTMSIEPVWGEAAVGALCTLSADEWDAVRDWATFAFRISPVDAVEIRHCLRARLLDPDLTGSSGSNMRAGAPARPIMPETTGR